MKNIIILSISILSVVCFSCTKKTNECQSRKMLKEFKNQECPEIVINPIYTLYVCGCDGKTYDSECEANKNGMEVVYEGACK